jgi:hypothetical protein
VALLETPTRDDQHTMPPSAAEPRTRVSSQVSQSPPDAVPPLIVLRRLPGAPPPSRKRGRAGAILIGLLSLLLIGGVAVAVSLLLQAPTPSGVPVPLAGTGTVVSVRSQGASQLLIRARGGNVVTLAMAGKRLLTQDGQALALPDVRTGDAVVVRTGNVVVDTSQARTSVRGIVAIGPDPRGDTLTVQLTPTRTVLVDIKPQTRINGQLPSVTSRMSILDSDQVRVVGILDERLDEMTRAWTIDRIGV